MSAGRVGRYSLIRLLGRGAMGAVYLARDPLFDREVALKTVVLPPGSSADEQELGRARFLQEARLSGRLSHPNIVAVHDCGEEGRTLWLSMEFVSGGNLVTRMSPEAGPFPLADRVAILADVAGALAHAHARDVLHRDVKPANILLTPAGSAKVSDFGIGKLLGGGVDLTATGEMVGSPAYMSPEQMRGEAVDARSDIFSFGILLYQVLTGRKPFPAENLTSLVRQVQHEQPTDPRGLNAEVPEHAVGILGRLLAKRPEDRFASAGEVETELRALVDELRGEPTGATVALSAPVPTPPEPMPILPPPAPPPLPPPSASTGGGRVGASTARGTAPPAVPVPTPAPSRRREVLAAAAAGLGLLAAGLFLSRSPSPPEAVTVAPAAPAEAAAGGTRPAPTTPPLPSPSPAPIPSPAPLVAEPVTLEPVPGLDIRPSSVRVVRVVVGRAIRLAVEPSQARVFLDGRFVGTAQDWNGESAGSDLVLAGDGSHTVRIAHPGRRDVVIEVAVQRKAPPVGLVRLLLQAGKPWGSTGPRGVLGAPEQSCRGAIRLDVAPASARVTVDGRLAGEAASFSQTDLHLGDVGVYSVTLAAGKRRRTVRIRVSPDAPDEVAVVRAEL